MPAHYRSDEAPIDRWMQVALAERYSATLREPLPEALIKLLEGPGED